MRWAVLMKMDHHLHEPLPTVGTKVALPAEAQYEGRSALQLFPISDFREAEATAKSPRVAAKALVAPTCLTLCTVFLFPAMISLQRILSEYLEKLF
jgi:hypothetical protein